MSIGFLLLLRSFWVVTWPVYDKFEFGAKIGWKMAKNGQKRPQMAKNDLNVWKMTFETIAIEILPLSRSFWVVTWLVCDNFFYGTQNGQKWPQNDQKLPDRMENDLWNHRHWNSAPLAVVLSGHMTSLWQFFLRDPKWPKMAKNGPKMTQNDVIVRKMSEIDFLSQIWSIFDRSRMAVPLSPSGGVWTGQNSDFAVVKNFWWVDRPKLSLHQNWP